MAPKSRKKHLAVNLEMLVHLQWQAKKSFFIEASLLTREAKTVYSPGNNGEHYWPFDSPENSKLAPRTKHKI